MSDIKKPEKIEKAKPSQSKPVAEPAVPCVEVSADVAADASIGKIEGVELYRVEAEGVRKQVKRYFVTGDAAALSKLKKEG